MLQVMELLSVFASTLLFFGYLQHTATHRDFVRRIKKTLYYGSSSAAYQCDRISRPLADYAAEMFSATHKGISLNRIDFAMVSQLRVTPCSLIISMIYLDRLNNVDLPFVQRITPSELFLVAMVRINLNSCGIVV